MVPDWLATCTLGIVRRTESDCQKSGAEKGSFSLMFRSTFNRSRLLISKAIFVSNALTLATIIVLRLGLLQQLRFHFITLLSVRDAVAFYLRLTDDRKFN